MVKNIRYTLKHIWCACMYEHIDTNTYMKIKNKVYAHVDRYEGD